MNSEGVILVRSLAPGPYGDSKVMDLFQNEILIFFNIIFVYMVCKCTQANN